MYIGNGYMITRNRVNTEWGLHKTDGRSVASGYDSISFEGSYFYCKSGKGWDIYSIFGRKLNTWPYEELGVSQNRNIPVRKNGYWGWLDFEGNSLIDPKFDEVKETSMDGVFLAKYIGSWGSVRFDGTFIVQPRFDQIRSVSNYFVARKGELRIILDREGNEVYRTVYRVTGSGPLFTEESGIFGIIFPNAVVVEPQFDSVKMVDTYVKAYKSGYVTLWSPDGGMILSPKDQIQEVYSFSEEYFHIKKHGMHGFVDTQAESVLPTDMRM